MTELQDLNVAAAHAGEPAPAIELRSWRPRSSTCRAVRCRRRPAGTGRRVPMSRTSSSSRRRLAWSSCCGCTRPSTRRSSRSRKTSRSCVPRAAPNWRRWASPTFPSAAAWWRIRCYEQIRLQRNQVDVELAAVRGQIADRAATGPQHAFADGNHAGGRGRAGAADPRLRRAEGTLHRDAAATRSGEAERDRGRDRQGRFLDPRSSGSACPRRWRRRDCCC